MKQQTCKICEIEINTKIESYVIVTDYKEGEFYAEGYYHNLCWHEAMHKKTLKKVKEGVISKLSHLRGKHYA